MGKALILRFSKNNFCNCHIICSSKICITPLIHFYFVFPLMVAVPSSFLTDHWIVAFFIDYIVVIGVIDIFENFRLVLPNQSSVTPHKDIYFAFIVLLVFGSSPNVCFQIWLQNFIFFWVKLYDIFRVLLLFDFIGGCQNMYLLLDRGRVDGFEARSIYFINLFISLPKRDCSIMKYFEQSLTIWFVEKLQFIVALKWI